MDNLLKKHTEWRNQCINLIASENAISPAVKEMYYSDLMHRYAEGLPYKRFYQGLKYYDKMEEKCTNAFLKHFKANFVDIRPISGAVANLAVFSALAEYGDNILSLGIDGGSHISHEKMGATGLLGYNIHNVNIVNGEIDLKNLKEKVKKLKPKFIILGGSVILFPQKVKEIREICKNMVIVYDAAHVLGLIFSGYFQDPLKEGADIITASTHKTFPGPQGGIIIGNISEELQKKIKRKIFPGILSNHHLHRIPALYETFKEQKKFGKQYIKQILKNSFILAKTLDDLGVKVLYKEKGYTNSHQVLIDVSIFGGGKECSQRLEDNNIIVNKNMIPGDTSVINPSGIRIGVQEMTRYGMKEKDFVKVGELIYKTLIKKRIKKEVVLLRNKFKKINYGT